MKKTLLILLIIGLIAFASIVGIVAYLLITDDSEEKSEPVITTQQEEDDNAPIQNDNDNQPSQELQDYTLSKFLTYPEVNLQYPEDWTVKQVGDLATQPEYELSKGEYILSITRPQGGGTECVFNSNYDPGMADFFTDLSQYTYKEVSSTLGDFYYFDTGTQYEFCGPSSQVTGKLVQMNAVGLITFKTPSNADPEIIGEMVAIIESFN